MIEALSGTVCVCLCAMANRQNVRSLENTTTSLVILECVPTPPAVGEGGVGGSTT